ncbi:MAG: acetyl-CoA carboxylase biotin carboxyl carrier protein subunit [Acidobacteria bacterium]|nr:MAG: acetyl-CoA carboxylase biotin carboxyl carrier protein subunit [Acidobacteriota bacterium]RLE24533.1 MAG: acetyl-CoA carboxylase biotin carboxyl carrier protein subunit [Acidobacteriota bacterium]
MKEVKFDINGKEYTVEINEFGAYEAVLTVNGRTYKVGLKDLGIESVSDIKPQPAMRPAATAPGQAQMFFSESTIEHPRFAGPVTHKPASVVNASSIVAPLPGLILKIMVKVGDIVKPGQDVMIMEAMKMENEIQSHINGTVREIKVKEGDSISEGDILIVLE